jgi:hypothetical protein
MVQPPPGNKLGAETGLAGGPPRVMQARKELTEFHESPRIDLQCSGEREGKGTLERLRRWLRLKTNCFSVLQYGLSARVLKILSAISQSFRR